MLQLKKQSGGNRLTSALIHCFILSFFLLMIPSPVNAQEWNNSVERRYPSDNQFDINENDSLIIEFKDPVDTIMGNFYLYNHNKALIETISLNGDQVDMYGDTLVVIKPEHAFYYHWTYYVQIDPNAFGINYPGIVDNDTWNFTPSFYMQEIMHSSYVQDDITHNKNRLTR